MGFSKGQEGFCSGEILAKVYYTCKFCKIFINYEFYNKKLQ